MSMERAELYEKYRMPYAQDAVPDLLRRIGDIDVVADIGAGTGQLARQFAPHCRIVYAVEPDASMRSVAQDALAGLCAGVVDGTAERTTLAWQSIDLIVAGNALHRFRYEACAEFARVLRPEGWLAVFSYESLDTAFQESLVAKLSSLPQLPAKSKRAFHRVSHASFFSGAETLSVRYEQSCIREWDEFFGAACAGIESPERSDVEFSQFEQVNRELFEEFAENGRITLRFATSIVFGQSARTATQQGLPADGGDAAAEG